MSCRSAWPCSAAALSAWKWPRRLPDLPRLLPNEDPELTELLRGRLVSEGLDIRTATEVQRVDAADGACGLTCSGGHSLQADRVLVATGRRPNVEGLGLEAAGVGYDKGGIKVDRRLRSSQKHIFACGDVCGPYPFTHMAEYQAGIVISNAVFPKRPTTGWCPGSPTPIRNWHAWD